MTLIVAMLLLIVTVLAAALGVLATLVVLARRDIAQLWEHVFSDDEDEGDPDDGELADQVVAENVYAIGGRR